MKLAGLLSAAVVAPLSLVAQEEGSSRDLREVVVTASRQQTPLKNSPQKVEIITQEKINSLPALNAADLLKETTTLDLIQYPGMKSLVGMRGFSPSAHSRSYTKILIDGLPAGTTNLSTIPTAIIERVEVVRGPYATLYGTDAMGGVINIITKKAAGASLARFGVGTNGRKTVDALATGRVSTRLSALLGYSYQSQDEDYKTGRENFFKRSQLEKKVMDERSYGTIYPNTSYSLSQVYGKLGYDFGRGWAAQLTGFYTMADRVKSPGNILAPSPSMKDISRWSLLGSLSYTGYGHQVSFKPYFSREQNDNYDTADNAVTNFISFGDDVREYGFKLQDAYSWSDFTLLAGVDYDALDYRSNRQSAKGISVAPYKPDNTNHQLSALTQLSYDTERLDVNLGLRASYIRYSIEANKLLDNEASRANYFILTPSLGVKYRLLEGLALHASLGQGFSLPDAFRVAGKYLQSYTFGGTLYTTNYLPNKDLKPEKSLSYDFGASYNAGAFSLDLTYFANHHTDMIVKDPKAVSPDVRYINADKAFMNGLEAMASLDLGQLLHLGAKLELYASYTHLFKAYFDSAKSKTDETKISRDLLYVAHNSANFGLNFSKNGLSTRLHARYKGSRLETDQLKKARPAITEADYVSSAGYTAKDKVLRQPKSLVFDYTASYKLSRRVEVGISVANLLDENYTEKDGYSMPGRSLSGVLTLKL